MKRLNTGTKVYIDCGNFYQPATIIGKGYNNKEVYLELQLGNNMYWEKRFIFAEEELTSRPIKPILKLKEN